MSAYGHNVCEYCGGSYHDQDEHICEVQDLKDMMDASIEQLQPKLAEATKEIEILRQYGNKDCTAMANEALAQHKQGEQ